MSRVQLGFLCCAGFVTLEAFQAVYLGAVFQSVDSFLIGSWVFGIAVIGCSITTALFRPNELLASIRAWQTVLILNLLAALTWSTYFFAVQLIEPAVVFTIFSGMVPLGTLIAAWFKMTEAISSKNRIVLLGNMIILVSLFFLGVITMLGLSGFTRGGPSIAFLGVMLSAISGGCTAFVILYSVRLNRKGVGPLAQFGLRFVFYTLLAIVAFWLGLDEKSIQTPPLEVATIVLIGLAVIALPLYLVQKAIPLVPASTIAAITALGPGIVFLMQLFDGRVDYSMATLAGLLTYMLGALLAVFGATKPYTNRKQS
ncbi:MAG: DMT family transporter [Hyphomicrobiales bacterium]|uniref:DMT family transporter n=1 Tax=Nisaea sp. TaxID=2024842 RepID=UPI00326FBA97